MLDAILKLLPLDRYDSNNFVLMEKCDGDTADTSIWNEYAQIMKNMNQKPKFHLKNDLLITKEQKKRML